MSPEEALKKFGCGKILKAEVTPILSLLEVAMKTVSPIMVEIGTFAGLTANLCAGFLKSNSIPGVIVSIDPHLRTEDVERGEAFTFGRIVFVEATSAEAAKKLRLRPGLVFIDGCHCARCVAADVEAWAPKVAPGGFMAFHDWTKEGRPVPPEDTSHPPVACGVQAGAKAAAKAMGEFLEHDRWAGGHTVVFRKLEADAT